MACRREGELELLDGFKRLTAGRQVPGQTSPSVRVVELDEPMAKAAILGLNRGQRAAREWIEQLGSESRAEREAASKQLTGVEVIAAYVLDPHRFRSVAEISAYAGLCRASSRAARRIAAAALHEEDRRCFAPRSASVRGAACGTTAGPGDLVAEGSGRTGAENPRTLLGNPAHRDAVAEPGAGDCLDIAPVPSGFEEGMI